MRKRQIFFSVEARDDLVKIGRWLTRFASNVVARRFVNRIRLAIRGLEYASERGTVRNAHGLRIIGVLPTVTIAFTVNGDAVTVHRILYNGQNWVADD